MHPGMLRRNASRVSSLPSLLLDVLPHRGHQEVEIPVGVAEIQANVICNLVAAKLRTMDLLMHQHDV